MVAINFIAKSTFQGGIPNHIYTTYDVADPFYQNIAAGNFEFDVVASSPDNTTTFLTVAAGEQYGFDQIKSTFISTLNTNSGTSFTAGVLVFVPDPVQLAIAKMDGSQLTAFKTSMFGGNTSEYIRGDGSKATFPSTASRSFNNAPGRSLTTSTGATGFQVSSTRDGVVNYSATITTTATIGGNQSGSIVLEVAPTNSSTPGDWVEIGRMTNGQAISLALVLQSVQTTAGQVGGVVPAGYYAKLRSINNSGTPGYAVNSGQEVLL